MLPKSACIACILALLQLATAAPLAGFFSFTKRVLHLTPVCFFALLTSIGILSHFFYLCHLLRTGVILSDPHFSKSSNKGNVTFSQAQLFMKHFPPSVDIARFCADLLFTLYYLSTLPVLPSFRYFLTFCWEIWSVVICKPKFLCGKIKMPLFENQSLHYQTLYNCFCIVIIFLWLLVLL